jgi:hypothetical protein
MYTTSNNIKIFCILATQCIYMFQMIISLYSINRFAFVTEIKYVFCEVGA